MLKKIVIFIFIVFAVFFVVRKVLKIPSGVSGSLETTLPDKNTLRFFALGDFGTNDDQQKQVAQWMESRCQAQKGVDGLLFLGDHFYPRGVKSSSDPLWEEVIEKTYLSKTCLSRAKIYPVLGNHDYKGNPQAQIDRSAMSSKWFMPYRFYSLKFAKKLKIVALDTIRTDFCFMKDTCVFDFMNYSLAKKDTRWTVVMGHFPLESSSPKGGDHTGDTFWLKKIKERVCNNSDAWLSGHAHHMEHRSIPGCQSEVFVSGAGGSRNDKIDPKKVKEFALSENGFLELEVKDENIVFSFIGKDSNILYRYLKSKGSTGG
jgi:tartrate-resistant acid phosphatase type 5